MEYSFSIGAFFVGLLFLAASVAFVRWHQWVADNFGNGVMSYDRYKLVALIACAVSILVMLNLHAFILVNILQLVFPALVQ